MTAVTGQRARVLLIAYACRPGESSEREVGWRWANLIQRHHDVTVLTRETHRPYIEAALAARGADEPAPDFVYYDLPAWASWYKKGERGLYLYYALWTLVTALRMRRVNRDGRWQITHFLTFGTLLWPQFFFLMNTRYLLGPVGGGERIPLALRRSFGIGGQIKIVVRRMMQRLLVLNPVFWANLAAADAILVRTRETLDVIPPRYRAKTDLLLETAVAPELVRDPPPARSGDGFEIVSVGRLITSKFNPLMFEALAAFKARWNRPFHVTIIGDGPERARLEALRDKLGLTAEVTFVGKKPADEVFAALKRADVYFSTTMKEGGTWAFFEAISCHLPIVCLKVNGPDMIVGDGCGIKVPPIGEDAARDGLAEGLLKLAEDPALRAALAEKALAHVAAQFTWDGVAAQIDRAYSALLTGDEPRR